MPSAHFLLQVYSRKQATIQNIVKMITGGRQRNEVLVGFGNGTNGFGSPLNQG